jgi:hypothetical protein
MTAEVSGTRKTRRPRKRLDFSKDATEKITKATADYVVAIQQAAVAAAVLKQSDQVSESDVDHAVSAIGYSRSNKKIRHLAELGGLLIGASLGLIGGLAVDSGFTVRNIFISFAPLVLGGVMYAYAWGRE